jgi:predicted nuclease of predicted toxin-antitoxin system
MNFKVDENLPAELVSDLVALGHDAETVVDEGLSGSADTLLMEHLRREQRVLLTMDKGIADVRAYPPEQMLVSCYSARRRRVAVPRWRSFGVIFQAYSA